METLAIVNPVILYFPEKKVKEVLFFGIRRKCTQEKTYPISRVCFLLEKTYPKKIIKMLL